MKFDFKRLPSDVDSVYSFLQPISIFDKHRKDIEKEFLKKEDQLIVADSLKQQKKDNEMLNTCLFLNFNYTSSLDGYVDLLLKEYSVSVNQIHGRLNDLDNLVNFGFGDEMDQDYKIIENIDDNEYLKFFKSFQYFQNTNYKKLLSYIDSDRYQVCVMGHSCGLSDRTMLNTIFEHENCASIKVFYHEYNGKDNYTDIIQNISRHFSNKKIMRDRIVPKSLCKPLPQTAHFYGL
ncbi:AbiH family protein [Olleya sp. Bg11-27]|uniref:AbiH family protein n=1 Tax=Olleya sp. Bg11-27 TaxID=2058135 RepID=UPI000C3093B6|nr:AbiH family protein [Olleya sp. Bg11-27]AUC77754.1 hypothetical protein CW732_04085 [Olleya sp. Bg11-27]